MGAGLPWGGVPEGGRRNQPVSMPTHLVQALRETVSLILEEGMPNRIRRHRISGKAFRAGSRGALRSTSSVTCRSPPTPSRRSVCRPVSRRPRVVRRMRDAYGILISTGIEKMRGDRAPRGHDGDDSEPALRPPHPVGARDGVPRSRLPGAETGEALGAAQAVLRRRDSLTARIGGLQLPENVRTGTERRPAAPGAATMLLAARRLARLQVDEAGGEEGRAEAPRVDARSVHRAERVEVEPGQGRRAGAGDRSKTDAS